MQVYTNQPGNSAEAMRTIVSTVGDKYLKTALDPEFLGFQRNDRQYIGFVSSYLSQYLASDPKMTIVPNASNSNEVVVSKLNAVLMKLTSVRAFINENLDVANHLNLEYLLKNEQLRSQLKEGLMTQIKAERNETPSEEYLNLVADKLLSGEFKSTSEFYAQESDFANKYKKGVDNVNANSINTQDKDKVAELAENNEILNNINAIAELFSRNDATKELTNRINKFGDVVKEIINKNKIEGTDKEKVKEVMASINIDGIDTSNLGFIQKELVNRFQNYMENALMFTSMHVGLPNFSNCVLFFDKPIADDLFASLPTDYRRILFVNMFNFKLFNTDNIALINKPIVDVMLTEGETEYTKLSDPELLKKPVKAKKPFVKKDNKFGGNKNGYMGKSKESGKSWK